LARLLKEKMKTLAIPKAWLLSLALVGSGCNPPAQPPNEPEPPELELQGVGFRFFRGEELRVVGRARAGTFRNDSSQVTAERVRLKFIRPDGDLRVEAGSATGDLRSQLARASGGVRFFGADGTRAFTPRALIDGKEQRALGNDPAELVGNGLRSRSVYGFILDFAHPGALSFIGPTTTRLWEAP
jgi:hypothetical protein